MMLLANLISTDVERDAVLWKEIKGGNEIVFREIFDIYSNVLFQYGLTITSDRELIKDCVQELFIVIWTNRQTLGMARSIKYYLIFSLRRLLLKNLGKKRRFFSLSSFSNSAFSAEAHDLSIIYKETNINNRLIIASALDKLPARQKEIIFLKFYQELKNDEIEIIMNINNQVVRNTLYKALQSLRQQLQRWEMNTYSQLLLAMCFYYSSAF